MTFAYDVRNRIATMVQGAAITTYNYGGSGYLRSETTATGVTTYTHNQHVQMTTVKYPDGTSSAYTYRADGKRRSVIEPGGSMTTFIWDGEDYLMEKS